MAADFSTAADSGDTDITDRFDLDTGQRDNFYDIARLVRKTGKVAPTGRLLLIMITLNTALETSLVLTVILVLTMKIFLDILLMLLVNNFH